MKKLILLFTITFLAYGVGLNPYTPYSNPNQSKPNASCHNHSNLNIHPLQPNNLISICYDLHLVYLDPNLKQPKVTIQYLSKQDLQISKSRELFFKVDQAYKKYQHSPKCYNKTGYDKGHLTPYHTADYSKRTIYQSNLMTNIVPQTAKFNRHIWTKFESNAVRTLSSIKSGYIVTASLPSDTTDTFCNMNIPKGFIKALYNSNNQFVWAYYVPHKEDIKLSKGATKQYLITEQMFLNLISFSKL